MIRCVSKFSSSSGSFNPGDYVPEHLVDQVMNESPESFIEIIEHRIAPEVEAKVMRPASVRRKKLGEQ